MNLEESPTAGATKDGTGHRPRKRARYTRVACELCKARKVKCSGLVPCSRCAELKVECKYSLTNSVYTDVKHERNARRLSGAPQQDLSHLLSTMKRVCDDIESSTSLISFPPSRARLLKRRHYSGFDARQRSKLAHSATMNTLWPALGLVQEFLGDHETVMPNGSGQDFASQATLNNATQCPDVSAIGLRAARSLFDMGYDEVVQNLTTFEHEVIPVYPCVSMAVARDRFERLFAAASPSPAAEPPGINIDLIDMELGKVLLAIAMLIRADDENPLILEVERHLIWNFDDVMRQEIVQMEDIIMAVLLTIFFIVKDQPVKAWRMCGFAARSCLELGLHKQIPRTHTNNAHDDPEFLADMFNCVYDLDTRIGFITGMPLSLRDEDISESVFDLHGRHPYLSTMVKVDRILGEVVTILNSSRGPSQKELDERADFCLYRLEKLVEDIRDVNLFPPDTSSRLPPATQVVMQQFITIRITHVRMLARIKCIKAPEAFSSWSHSARSLVSLAISSVDQHQKIFSASGETGVSRLFCFLLERLLRMSVSVLIVAVSYNPQVYAPRCRTAFHTALDLLTTLQSRRGDQSPSTIISCSLAELRKIGERIQMPPLGDASVAPAEPFPQEQRQETPRPSSVLVYPQFDCPASCMSTDHDLMGNPRSNWESEFADIGFIEGILESVRGHSRPSDWKLIKNS